MDHNWIFEPCSPEDARDTKGIPWAHAVRGQKPQRPMVLGYGHTESAADFDARHKASQQDAREALGQRGEVVTTLEYTPMPQEIDFVDERRRVIREICRMFGAVIYEPADSPIVKISI